MKYILIILFLINNSFSQVTIPTWRDYKNVTFTEKSDKWVKFTHANGIGKVEIATLPLDIQEKLKSVPEVSEGEKDKEFKNKVDNKLGAEIKGRVLEVTESGVRLELMEYRGTGETKEKIGLRVFIYCDSGEFYDGQILKGKVYWAGNFRYESKGGDTLAIPAFAVDAAVAIERLTKK